MIELPIVRRPADALRPLVCSFLLPLLAACNPFSPIEEIPPTLWEGELLGTQQFPTVRGSAAAVGDGNQRRTQIGIGVIGAPGLAVVDWIARHGSCAQPGGAVAPADRFPLIETDEDGNGDAEATVAHVFQAGSAYHVVVLTTDSPVQTMACGNLEQQPLP
jgi:hypothetical protein